MQLESNDPLTLLLKSKGLQDWGALSDFVKNIPYGRNENRTDFSLVIKEHQGTCSSKHAFLKKVAELNQLDHIELILGMYKMSETNTPKIGKQLTSNNLSYIPEAHCYLKIAGKRVDLTNATSAIEPIEKDILEELNIRPQQVATFKVNYHQTYLKEWIKSEKLPMSFEKVWAIRELCIANLTE